MKYTIHNFFDSVISPLPPHELQLRLGCKNCSAQKKIQIKHEKILKRNEAQALKNTETRRLVICSWCTTDLPPSCYIYCIFYIQWAARISPYFYSLFMPFSRWFCFSSSLFGFFYSSNLYICVCFFKKLFIIFFLFILFFLFQSDEILINKLMQMKN